MKPNDTIFHTIGIICKHGETNITPTLVELTAFLHQRGATILFDESAVGLIADVDFVSRETLGTEADLAIVLGGDGTILNAGRTLASFGIAIIGINQGRLGFLADISPTGMIPALTGILDGHYVSDSRTLLEAEILRNGEPICRSPALNDIVVHSHDVVRMIEFETLIDGHFVNIQRADGMVVATPTGSTAYALSSGGPLIVPGLGLDAVLLVPICPHTMSNRPLVISADVTISIKLDPHSRTSAQVAFDGQGTTSLLPGDQVIIHRMQNRLTLLHLEDYDYFSLLRKKLHWAENPQPQ